MAGQRFLGRPGQGNQDMSRAKFCKRCKKMFVHTVPPWSTQRKCSARVCNTGNVRTESNALSQIVRVHRCWVAPFFVFAVSSITHCHVRVEICESVASRHRSEEHTSELQSRLHLV